MIFWSCETLPGLYVIRAETVVGGKLLWRHLIISRAEWTMSTCPRALLECNIRDLDSSIKASINT